MKIQILIFLLLVILILSICLIIFASISQISGGHSNILKSVKEDTVSILKSGGSNIEELEGLVHLILEEYSKKWISGTFNKDDFASKVTVLE